LSRASSPAEGTARKLKLVDSSESCKKFERLFRAAGCYPYVRQRYLTLQNEKPRSGVPERGKGEQNQLLETRYLVSYFYLRRRWNNIRDKPPKSANAKPAASGTGLVTIQFYATQLQFATGVSNDILKP